MSFVISKLGWMVLQPSNLLAILLAGAVVLAWRWLALGLILAATIVVVLPVGRWLIQPLEARFPRPAELPADVAGIIVLGGPQVPPITESRGVLATNRRAERLIEAKALALRYPEAILVFSGGDGTLGGGSSNEAVVNRRFVELMGIDESRVVYENRSRNTWENARFTQELVEPDPDQSWLLVTSAAHMPRSIGIFRKIGWEVLPFPVDYESTGGGDWPARLDVGERLVELDHATREWLGLLAYYLMGRTASLFPAP